jgi:signal transduction histidine kinase
MPTEEVVAEALRGVAARHGTRLELDLAGGPLETERLETLVRVACEAVTNAARHSGAPSVRVELEPRRQRVRLRVVDDGCGFDARDACGYGLSGMRERAEAIGGNLKVVSAPGRGTIVEAIL